LLRAYAAGFGADAARRIAANVARGANSPATLLLLRNGKAYGFAVDDIAKCIGAAGYSGARTDGFDGCSTGT